MSLYLKDFRIWNLRNKASALLLEKQLLLLFAFFSILQLSGLLLVHLFFVYIYLEVVFEKIQQKQFKNNHYILYLYLIQLNHTSSANLRQMESNFKYNVRRLIETREWETSGGKTIRENRNWRSSRPCLLLRLYIQMLICCRFDSYYSIPRVSIHSKKNGYSWNLPKVKSMFKSAHYLVQES